MINDKIIRGEPICMKPSWVRPEEGGEEGDEDSISQRYNCSVITTIIIEQLLLHCYCTVHSTFNTHKCLYTSGLRSLTLEWSYLPLNFNKESCALSFNICTN